jgi:hypothetical protein
MRLPVPVYHCNMILDREEDFIPISDSVISGDQRVRYSLNIGKVKVERVLLGKQPMKLFVDI